MNIPSCCKNSFWSGSEPAVGFEGVAFVPSLPTPHSTGFLSLGTGASVPVLGCVPALGEHSHGTGQSLVICAYGHPWGEGPASWHARAEHVHLPWQAGSLARAQRPAAAGPVDTRAQASSSGSHAFHTAFQTGRWLTSASPLQLVCPGLSQQPLRPLRNKGK